MIWDAHLHAYRNTSRLMKALKRNHVNRGIVLTRNWVFDFGFAYSLYQAAKSVKTDLRFGTEFYIGLGTEDFLSVIAVGYKLAHPAMVELAGHTKDNLDHYRSRVTRQAQILFDELGYRQPENDELCARLLRVLYPGNLASPCDTHEELIEILAQSEENRERVVSELENLLEAGRLDHSMFAPLRTWLQNRIKEEPIPPQYLRAVDKVFFREYFAGGEKGRERMFPLHRRFKLDEIKEAVSEAGGRVYLSIENCDDLGKDKCLSDKVDGACLLSDRETFNCRVSGKPLHNVLDSFSSVLVGSDADDMVWQPGINLKQCPREVQESMTRVFALRQW